MKAAFVFGTMALLLASAAFAMGPPSERGPTGAPEQTTLLDTALAVNDETGEFSILIAALEAADDSFLETLDARGQRTVFAPTDAAFVSLLEELDATAEQVLGNEALLNDVLAAHIAPGRRDSTVVTGSEQIRMISSDKIQVDGTTLIDENGREIGLVLSTIDVFADNGIIHAIDHVILPE